MNRKERRRTAKTNLSSVADDGYVQALGFYSARRHDEAEVILWRLLQRRPNHAEGLRLMGAIAHSAGRLDDAISFFGRAVAVDPKDARNRNNLGLAYQSRGDNERAVMELREALAHAPGAAEIHANLAKALHSNGDLAAAERHYQQAIALNPRLLEARCDWAVVLYAQGKIDEAIAQYEKALEIDRSSALALHNLGRIYFERGDPRAAETLLRRYLDIDAADRHGARFLLAAMGKEQLPARTSDAFLQRLYAQRAERWDDLPDYHAHRLVADALARHAGENAMDIADVGCGTGLVGPLVRTLATRLDGVDLSAEMLAVAARKGVYDNLMRQELTSWLSGAGEHYDAVVSAATLIHFGDLAPVMKAAAAALHPGGTFVFTVLAPTDPAGDDEATAGTEELALGGCFLHGRSYVRATAANAGFMVEELSEAIHEESRGQPVPGLIVVLRKPA